MKNPLTGEGLHLRRRLFFVRNQSSHLFFHFSLALAMLSGRPLSFFVHQKALLLPLDLMVHCMNGRIHI
jgi:hypothetical protein